MGIETKSELLFAPKLTTLENVKSIKGGQHHTMVLTNDNKCYVIGRKDYGRLGIGQVSEHIETLTQVKSLDDKVIEHITCGEACSFAITNDGKYNFLPIHLGN